jgi:hypothetical protein
VLLLGLQIPFVLGGFAPPFVEGLRHPALGCVGLFAFDRLPRTKYFAIGGSSV